jgi:hypothetical protein
MASHPSSERWYTPVQSEALNGASAASAMQRNENILRKKRMSQILCATLMPLDEYPSEFSAQRSHHTLSTPLHL